MSLWKIILYALLFWFLYNLVFRFIIPVYRTSKQMKRQFRDMQEKMQQQTRAQQAQSATPPPKTASAQKHSDDYIDFEEIK